MRNPRSCLILGIAGVGKSTLTTELASRGKDAHDADLVPDLGNWHTETGEIVAWQSDPEWALRHNFYWNPTALDNLLAIQKADSALYLAGISQNALRYAAPLFEHVVFLDASTETIAQRRASPTRDTPYPNVWSSVQLETYAADLRNQAQQIGAIMLNAERSTFEIAEHIIDIVES